MKINYAIYTCPIKNAVALIGDRWTLFILRTLYYDKNRQGFNELQQSLTPISSRTLAKKLQKLTAQNIVKKKTLSISPPKVEYSLTEKGLALQKVLQSMARWYLKEFNR